jgi:hypothetical protein
MFAEYDPSQKPAFLVFSDAQEETIAAFAELFPSVIFQEVSLDGDA